MWSLAPVIPSAADEPSSKVHGTGEAIVQTARQPHLLIQLKPLIFIRIDCSSEMAPKLQSTSWNKVRTIRSPP